MLQNSDENKIALRNERLQYVDIARGLTMLCVILGHMELDNLNILIFSFHIPLFFLVSG